MGGINVYINCVVRKVLLNTYWSKNKLLTNVNILARIEETRHNIVVSWI